MKHASSEKLTNPDGGMTRSTNLYDLGKNNWTPVPNPIVEQLCRAKLTASQSRVVWYLLRKTLGYYEKKPTLRKTIDRIPLSQFEKGTGLDRRRACEALDGLADRKITLANGIEKRVKTYGMNFNVTEWNLSLPHRTDSKAKARKSVPRGQDKVSHLDRIAVSSPSRTNLSSPVAPSKETKENLKKDPKESAGPMALEGTTAGASEPQRPGPVHSPAFVKKWAEMAKSGFYTEDQLFSLKEKTLEELEKIHRSMSKCRFAWADSRFSAFNLDIVQEPERPSAAEWRAIEEEAARWTYDEKREMWKPTKA